MGRGGKQIITENLYNTTGQINFGTYLVYNFLSGFSVRFIVTAPWSFSNALSKCVRKHFDNVAYTISATILTIPKRPICALRNCTRPISTLPVGMLTRKLEHGDSQNSGLSVNCDTCCTSAGSECRVGRPESGVFAKVMVQREFGAIGYSLKINRTVCGSNYYLSD